MQHLVFDNTIVQVIEDLCVRQKKFLSGGEELVRVLTCCTF